MTGIKRVVRMSALIFIKSFMLLEKFIVNTDYLKDTAYISPKDYSAFLKPIVRTILDNANGNITGTIIE
jgi:hypothetical protein